MNQTLTLLSVPLSEAESDNTWLIRYDGKSSPAAPWTAIGKPNATIGNGSLSLKDDSKDGMAAFEAEWNGDLDDKEIVVEARVTLAGMVGHRESPTATWPLRDGAPICIQVCDGKREEGIVLAPPQDKHPEAAKDDVRTLTDRFARADTRDAFHTASAAVEKSRSRPMARSAWPSSRSSVRRFRHHPVIQFQNP